MRKIETKRLILSAVAAATVSGEELAISRLRLISWGTVFMFAILFFTLYVMVEVVSEEVLPWARSRGYRHLESVRYEVATFLYTLGFSTLMLWGKLRDDHGGNIWGTSVQILGLHHTQLLFGAIVCAAGFGAHKFKQESQWFYGVVEVVFGVGSCFVICMSLSPEKPDLARWASLIGAGYVIARGLNNISDAKKKFTQQN